MVPPAPRLRQTGRGAGLSGISNCRYPNDHRLRTCDELPPERQSPEGLKFNSPVYAAFARHLQRAAAVAPTFQSASLPRQSPTQPGLYYLHPLPKPQRAVTSWPVAPPSGYRPPTDSCREEPTFPKDGRIHIAAGPDLEPVGRRTPRNNCVLFMHPAIIGSQTTKTLLRRQQWHPQCQR